MIALAKRKLGLMAVLLPLAACGDQAAGNGVLLLGWTFADGRRCADSGVERVVLTPKDELSLLMEADCPQGYGDTAIRLDLSSGERELQLTGLSAAETPIYRATFHLNLRPGTAQDRLVELTFTGGL